MATIRKRGNSWQAQIRITGYPAQTRTFRHRADALAWAADMESEMRRGVWLSRVDAERTTFGEALQRYEIEITPQKKGAPQERYRIQQLLRHPLSTRPLATIRGQDIAHYRDRQLQRGYNPITVNNDLILISHLFSICRREWGMETLQNPVKQVRRPKLPPGRERRLDPHEEQAILDAADPTMKVIITLALETGMRRGEILRLRRADVRGRVVTLLDTKNASDRRVPLSTRAFDAIASLPARMDGKLFDIEPAAASVRFHTICLKLGIENLRFHDLRHEATSRFFERGLSLIEVASITGHKTLQMLERYTHLKAHDLADKLG